MFSTRYLSCLHLQDERGVGFCHVLSATFGDCWHREVGGCMPGFVGNMRTRDEVRCLPERRGCLVAF